MFKIDNKYGEFVFLAKNIIQGPQETWNIEGDAYGAFTFPQLLHNQSIWYPWHCITSYLGFSAVNDGAQINSCSPQFIWCIFFHYNPVDANLSHGKNNGLVNYIKGHQTSLLKKHISHEHVEKHEKWDLFLMQKVERCGNL
jgi:hypothetical protein